MSNLFFQAINTTKGRLLELVVIFHLLSRHIVVIRRLIILNKVKFSFFGIKFLEHILTLALFFNLGLFEDLSFDLLLDHFFCDLFGEDALDLRILWAVQLL
jgi:hypothetical protein